MLYGLIGGVFLLVAIPRVILAFFIWKFLPEKVSGSQKTGYGKSGKSRISWIIAAIYIIVLMNALSLLMLGPTYMSAVENLDLGFVDFLFGISIVMAIPFHLFGGILADKLKPKRATILLLTVYAIFLFLFVTSQDYLRLIGSMFMLYSLIQGVIVSLLVLTTRKIPHEILGSTGGLLLAVGYAGGALGPLIVGYIADITSFNLAFLFLGIITIGGIILTALTK